MPVLSVVKNDPVLSVEENVPVFNTENVPVPRKL